LAVLNVASNFLFNYLLIKKFGALGAAYATCLSYMITLVVVFVIANKLISISWFDLNKIFSSKKYLE
jgi:Na+-driven multidrug efflux pump